MDRLIAELQRQMALQDDDTTGRIARECEEVEARWKRDLEAAPIPFRPLPRSSHEAAHRSTLSLTDMPAPDSGKVLSKNTYIGQDKHFSSTPLRDLKPITLRQMQCHWVHKGYYLICRTFLSTVRSVAVEFYAEDTQGDAILICAYNLPGTFQAGRCQLEAQFPLGTTLAVREPWMKMAGVATGTRSMMIRVDSPSDIVVLTPDTGLLRGLQWKMESRDHAALARRSASGWKALGDRYFKDKMDVAALMAWTHALSLDPSLTAVPLNRAQAYINLGWHGAALAEALTAADIVTSATHIYKATYRAAVAEYRLGLYREAFDRLRMLEGDGAEDRKALMKQCIDRLKERDGKFDFLRMYRASSGKGLVPLDTADFVSTAIQVGEVSGCGGGRGIKATRDICAGGFLMVQKPFSVAMPDNVSPQEVISVVDFSTRRRKDASQLAVMERAVSRLLACPDDIPRIYGLYAGPKYPSLPPDYDLRSASGYRAVDPLSWKDDVDVSRVEGVVTYNPFDPRPLGPYRLGNGDFNVEDSFGSRCCALYTSPSFFNHACYSNAHWICFGTTMVVRAVADVSAGEEITIPYVVGASAFERGDRLKSFFVEPCRCAMCAEDRRDGKDKCMSRLAIADEASALLGMSKTGRAREARRILKKMRGTYDKGIPKRTPQQVLFRTYANAMHAVEDVARDTGDADKFRQAIELGVDSLRAIGFEDVDGALGPAATSTRFELPFGKRRLCLAGCADQAILSIAHVAASFMDIGQNVRAERWYRGAWWVHEAFFGGGQGLFDERFGDLLRYAPKPFSMEYKWN